MERGDASPDARAYSGYAGSWGASPHVVAAEPTAVPGSGGGEGVSSVHDGPPTPARRHGRRLFRQATERTSEVRAALSPEAEDLGRRMAEEGKVDEQYLTTEDLRVLWKGLWWMCGVVHPHSPVYEAWWITVLVLIYVTCFLMPFQLAFTGYGTAVDGWSIAMWTLDAIYFVNMGVTFFVAYYKGAGSTVLVVNKRKIAKQYLKSWFWIDLLSVFPWDALSRAVELDPTFYNIASLSRLLRMYHIATLFRWMEENLVFSYFGVVMAKLLNLLILTAHVTGCGFFWIARVEKFESDTWVAQDGLVGASTWTQYVSSLYWAVMTLSTVGYGDISPGTTAERIYSTVVMIFNMGVFGYVTGNFVVLVTQADAEILRWRHAIADARRFGKRNQLPHDSRMLMKHYLILKRRTHEQSTDVLEELNLPPAMRTSVLKHMLKATFVKAFCFQGCSSHFVDQVLSHSEVRSYYQGSPIVKAGEVNESLFIMHSGRAELRLPSAKDAKNYGVSEIPDMGMLSAEHGQAEQDAESTNDSVAMESHGAPAHSSPRRALPGEGAPMEDTVRSASIYPESGLIYVWRMWRARQRAKIIWGRKAVNESLCPASPAHKGVECLSGISTLKHGDVFGDENIGWNTPQCWSVFATTFCRVARVSKKHIHSLEDDFPGDCERLRRNIHGRCCGVTASLKALIEDESHGRVLEDLDISMTAASAFGTIKSTLMRAYAPDDTPHYVSGTPTNGFEHVWDRLYRQRTAYINNIPLHSEESETNFFAMHIPLMVREASAHDPAIVSARVSCLSAVLASVSRAKDGLARAIAGRKRRVAALMAEAIGINDVEALHALVRAEAGLDAADFARRGARVIRPPKPLAGCVSAELRRTPLHTAASLGSVSSVQFLLSFGADVNARDAHLDTPLSLALARRKAAEGSPPRDRVDPEYDVDLIVRELRAAGAADP